MNKHYEVKNFDKCFSSCENCLQFTLSGETTVNDGDLLVYYASLPSNISTYRLKLLFSNGTGDSEVSTLRSK